MNARFHSFAAALLALVSASPVRASESYLWITEVVPSTGQVEVTNVGPQPVTLPSDHPLCHRSSHADVIPDGTTFAAGESKVYLVTLSNPADSDLWLYRNDSDFNNGANLIAGVKWGPAADVGKTGLASSHGNWNGAAEFVPAPAAGMALQLTGTTPFGSGNWSEGTPDLGNYTPLPLSISIAHTTGSDTVTLSWTGGSPPYRVRSSGDLHNWKNEGGVNGSISRDYNRSQMGDQIFFQVIPGVVLEQSAVYRITFRTRWSRDVFETVPDDDHFSGLIGATHNDQVAFWAPGQLASAGIESMAETGSKSALTSEINAAISAGTAGEVISGGNLGQVPSLTRKHFTATRSHPLVTLVSMVAPSPDWFVGVRDVSMLAEDDEWVDELAFDLFSYDAGTDDGTDFTSSDAESTPHVPIVSIANTTPFAVLPSIPDPPRRIASFFIERTE